MVRRVTQVPPRAQTQPGPGQPTEILGRPPAIPPILTAPFVPSLPEIPGYEIVRLLDTGGMSNIYLAYQKGLNRKVAIKMIRPQDSLDENIRKRFLLEASSIAALQHPNVVRIHEIGEIGGRPFLCLEYISGGNLERRIRDNPPTPHEAAEIVRQLADAMQMAHEHSIIHRDLKPANILWVDIPVNESGETRIEVKITDFGLARILCEASDQTKSGFAIGTPSFMSPEQASGHPDQIGKGTDIYGLGAILYELLTKQPPFHGTTALDTIQMVRFDAPVRPSLLNPAVPRDLERICLQCLEKKPEDRYPMARAVANDLRRFQQGQTVSAHRVNSLGRWARRLQRNPYKGAAYSAGLALLVVGGLFLTQMVRDPGNARPFETRVEVANLSSGEPTAALALPDNVKDVLSRIRQGRQSGAGVALAALGNEWVKRIDRENAGDPSIQLAVGDAYLHLKQLQPATIAYERALTLAEEQTRAMQDGFEAWGRLGLAQERLGDVRLLEQDRKAAIADYRKSMTVREMLAQDDPTDLRWSADLAGICGKQGNAYVLEGEPFTAVLLYSRRLDLLNGPLAVQTRAADICETHERLAELYQTLGNAKASADHRNEAQRISAKDGPS